jgi:hypothetical protein
MGIPSQLGEKYIPAKSATSTPCAVALLKPWHPRILALTAKSSSRPATAKEVGNEPRCPIRDEGTVWIFKLLTPVAQQWFAEHVQSESWQLLGTSLVVEHRFVMSLIQGIMDAGFGIG